MPYPSTDPELLLNTQRFAERAFSRPLLLFCTISLWVGIAAGVYFAWLEAGEWNWAGAAGAAVLAAIGLVPLSLLTRNHCYFVVTPSAFEYHPWRGQRICIAWLEVSSIVANLYHGQLTLTLQGRQGQKIAPESNVPNAASLFCLIDAHLQRAGHGDMMQTALQSEGLSLPPSDAHGSNA